MAERSRRRSAQDAVSVKGTERKDSRAGSHVDFDDQQRNRRLSCFTTWKAPAVRRESRLGCGRAQRWDTSWISHPKGQWIRKTFLGVEPTHLSEESLSDLSVRSVGSTPLLDDPERWVDRDVDEKLRNHFENRVQFVLGESGVGKSVACLKCLQQHVEAGGFGLVVTDGVLGTSLTVEDAVERTLRNLQPTLVDGVGSEALWLASENDEQFLLVIEDINRSAQPPRLVEKLSAWSVRAGKEKDRRGWRILCPVWPRTIALANNKAGKNENALGHSGRVVHQKGRNRGSKEAAPRRNPRGSRSGGIGSWLRPVADRLA